MDATADLDRQYLAGKGRLSEIWLRRELDRFLTSTTAVRMISEVVNRAISSRMRRLRRDIRDVVAEMLAERGL